MIDDLLYADWDEPPAEMSFELPFGELLGLVASEGAAIATALGREREQVIRDPAWWRRASRYYCMVPAIVNVMLNYKICVEHGLPLHPTVYFEIEEATARGPLPEGRIGREAQALFLESISLARAAAELAPASGARLQAFAGRIPPELGKFVYTSVADKYTWKASDPAKIRALAAKLAAGGKTSLLVGAAHGAIMPGLLLAEYADAELYYIRFSMFKRHDKLPVLAPSDESLLSAHGGRIVLFDEDVAKGTTLSVFSESLRRFAPHAETAAIIRHAASACKPDFTGVTWWD